jgi:hypothetical protein
MARRITITEWPAQLETVEVALKARWPWLITYLDTDRHQLHIETEDSRVSGTVRLDSVRGTPGVMVAHCHISGGGGIIGNLSEAEDAMFCCRAILDALHRAHAMLCRLEVYAFDIPCLACTGTGTVTKSVKVKGKQEPVREEKVCSACNGTGKKPVDE